MKLLLSLCLVSALSCVAPRVDPLALFGAAEATWPAVEQDYERGIQDAIDDLELSAQSSVVLHQDADRLETALAEKDRGILLAVPWDAMAPWASRGIEDKLEDGDIGPGVAVSLREQLVNFTATIHRLQGRR